MATAEPAEPLVCVVPDRKTRILNETFREVGATHPAVVVAVPPIVVAIPAWFGVAHLLSRSAHAVPFLIPFDFAVSAP